MSSTWPLTKAQATNECDRDTLDSYYSYVRNETERLSSPLSAEDQVIQSMPDASPTKWHRAHVTWFFETMILSPNDSSYSRFNEKYAYLYNVLHFDVHCNKTLICLSPKIYFLE